MNDLFRLGDVLLGAEGKIDDAMSPEVMEACVQFFAQAFIETNRHFTEQHGAVIESLTPELINPDGKPAGLLPLAEFYEGVACAAFEFSVEPNIDSRFQMLVQAELLRSLMDLLPGYDAEPQTVSEVERRRALHKAEEAAAAEAFARPASESPGSTPEARKPQDRAAGNWNIDLLLDVELPIVVSFGETEMPLKEILKFGAGSVIELNKSVNDPVVIKVNEKPIARGEVVMVDGNYGVRILEVESTAERLRSLG
jgi:flagellar motor switch protein FliN/FliY